MNPKRLCLFQFPLVYFNSSFHFSLFLVFCGVIQDLRSLTIWATTFMFMYVILKDAFFAIRSLWKN